MKIKQLSSLALFLSLMAFISLSARAELECTAETPQNCLDGVGPAVTNPDKIRNTSAQISQQLRKSDKDDNSVVYLNTATQTGLSAGDTYSNIGVWSSYVFTDFEADIPINSLVQPTASYEADNHNLMVGIDTLISDKWIVGLAVGIENTEIRTEYNGGLSDADGYTIAPYTAYFINDVFSVDAAGGYSYLDYDTDRIDNISGGTILGDFNSDRLFFSANLNAFLPYKDFLISGRISYQYTQEDQNAYRERGPNTARTIGERHVDLTQVLVGLDVAYPLGKFEPFATIAYQNDFGQDDGTDAGGLPGSVGATQPDDDDEIRAGLGMRYYGETISASLEWLKVFERDTYESDSIFLSIRADL